MWKNFLSIVVGLVFGNVGIMLLHKAASYLYPFPEGMDQNNMDHIASYLETAPLGAFFMVVIAHLGGSFLGGLGASLLSKNMNTAYIVGGLFTVFGIINLTILPHPLWMWAEVLFYVPAAYLGFKIIKGSDWEVAGKTPKSKKS